MNSPAMIVVPTEFPLNHHMRRMHARGRLIITDEFSQRIGRQSLRRS